LGVVIAGAPVTVNVAEPEILPSLQVISVVPGVTPMTVLAGKTFEAKMKATEVFAATQLQE
jgi:hypothetical protein